MKIDIENWGKSQRRHLPATYSTRPAALSPSMVSDFDCVSPFCLLFVIYFDSDCRFPAAASPPPPRTVSDFIKGDSLITHMKSGASFYLYLTLSASLPVFSSIALSLALGICSAFLAIAICGHITNASPAANVVTLCCCTLHAARCMLHVAWCTVRLRLHNLRRAVPSLSIIMSTR